MDSTFLIDDYVKTAPGTPFRLFPFGEVVKGGKRHVITPESAKKFRLPHYKPAIKLGSHREETPAGGHIIGLEVREDGLYAIPEITPKGATAISEGNYRYHSPEVIWADGGLENPLTGEIIEGPLIVGAALLHDPHLGEAAALYGVEKIQAVKEKNMADDYVQVEPGLWSKIQERLFLRDEPTPQPEPAPADEVDEFEAVAQERDEFKSKYEALVVEQERRGRVEHFVTELDNTEFADDTETAEKLADMSEEQAEWVLEKFRALSARAEANEKLTREIGDDAPAPANDREALDQAVKAKAKEAGVDYNKALILVREEQPELFQ